MNLIQVYVIQCKSTGKFLTVHLNHTINLNKAGYTFDRQSAIDTAMTELDMDFNIYDFWLPEERTNRIASGLSLDPHL